MPPNSWFLLLDILPLNAVCVHYYWTIFSHTEILSSRDPQNHFHDSIYLSKSLDNGLQFCNQIKSKGGTRLWRIIALWLSANADGCRAIFVWRILRKYFDVTIDITTKRVLYYRQLMKTQWLHQNQIKDNRGIWSWQTKKRHWHSSTHLQPEIQKKRRTGGRSFSADRNGMEKEECRYQADLQ